MTAEISVNGDRPDAATRDAIETAAPDATPDSQPEVVYNFAEMDEIELVTHQLAVMKKIKRARKKQASAVAKADKSLQSKRDKIARQGSRDQPLARRYRQLARPGRYPGAKRQ